MPCGRLKDAQKYNDYYANKYGIPSNLLFALIDYESSWNPCAANPKSSARGLGQIIASTRKYLGITDALDPNQSLDGAARYLKEQYNKFGSWEIALAAYHRGPRAITAAGGKIPSGGDASGTQTRNYVREILRKAGALFTGRDPFATSPQLPPGSSQIPPTTGSVEGLTTIPLAIDFNEPGGLRQALIYGSAGILLVLAITRLR